VYTTLYPAEPAFGMAEVEALALPHPRVPGS